MAVIITRYFANKLFAEMLWHMSGLQRLIFYIPQTVPAQFYIFSSYQQVS